MKYCLKLNESIDRLQQAGHKWYKIIYCTLADLSFKKCEANPAIFYIHSGKQILILAIHIDDCTMTGLSRALIQQYKPKQIQQLSKYALTT